MGIFSFNYFQLNETKNDGIVAVLIMQQLISSEVSVQEYIF